MANEAHSSQAVSEVPISLPKAITRLKLSTVGYSWWDVAVQSIACLELQMLAVLFHYSNFLPSTDLRAFSCSQHKWVLFFMVKCRNT